MTSYDITLACWIVPPFVGKSDCKCEIYDADDMAYDAYFEIGGWNADEPKLLGVIRQADDKTFDRDAAFDVFGADRVKLWESQCPAWGDPDCKAQAGYDEAREKME